MSRQYRQLLLFDDPVDPLVASMRACGKVAARIREQMMIDILREDAQRNPYLIKEADPLWHSTDANDATAISAH
jgi:hypothetical protein